LIMVVGTELTVILYRRISGKILVIAGLLLMALANFLLSTCTLAASMVVVVFYWSFRYFGVGVAQTPLSDYGMKVIPQELAGHASSLMSWSKQIATVVSTNVLTVVLSINTLRFHKELYGTAEMVVGSAEYKQAMLLAVNADYFYLGVIALTAATIAFFAMKRKVE